MAKTARGVEFDNPADQFNKLSPIPLNVIDLGDGRELKIIEWHPHGLDGYEGVPVDIKGMIVEKK